MSYTPTTTDLRILQQSKIQISTKVQLLNQNKKPIEEIQGYVTAGNITIDAESDIRRTASITMYPSLEGYDLTEQTALWYNKYIRIYLGFYDLRSKTVVWYCIGTFLSTKRSFAYDTETNELTISLSDLMAELDGTKNGQLSDITTTIPEGEILRDAMIATITLCNCVTDYIVEEMGTYYDTENNNTVPYDLEFSAGDNILSIITSLRDLYPAWETFFDVYGTFYCQMIPTCENDDAVLDSNDMETVDIYSESIDIDDTNIKNVVKVVGQVLDVDRYADSCVTSNSVYNVTIESYEEYTTNDYIAINVDSANTEGQEININSIGDISIYNLSTNDLLEADTMKPGQTYVFKYLDGIMWYLGQYQVTAVAMLVSAEPDVDTKANHVTLYNCNNISYVVNPDSPYTIENFGTYLDVKTGGDYENIYSDSLATEQAEYDLWLEARLTDSITIETSIIPFLDVNQKIGYTLRKTGETHEYITKNISYNFAGDVSSSSTMTITMSRYYNLYPDIISAS